jgi:hypothetical protein
MPEEAATDERSIFNSIPIANFKSNHLSRKKPLGMRIDVGSGPEEEKGGESSGDMLA